MSSHFNRVAPRISSAQGKLSDSQWCSSDSDWAYISTNLLQGKELSSSYCFLYSFAVSRGPCAEASTVSTGSPTRAYAGIAAELTNDGRLRTEWWATEGTSFRGGAGGRQPAAHLHPRPGM